MVHDLENEFSEVQTDIFESKIICLLKRNS